MHNTSCPIVRNCAVQCDSSLKIVVIKKQCIVWEVDSISSNCPGESLSNPVILILWTYQIKITYQLNVYNFLELSYFQKIKKFKFWQIEEFKIHKIDSRHF